MQTCKTNVCACARRRSKASASARCIALPAMGPCMVLRCNQIQSRAAMPITDSGVNPSRYCTPSRPCRSGLTHQKKGIESGSDPNSLPKCLSHVERHVAVPPNRHHRHLGTFSVDGLQVLGYCGEDLFLRRQPELSGPNPAQPGRSARNKQTPCTVDGKYIPRTKIFGLCKFHC